MPGEFGVFYGHFSRRGRRFVPTTATEILLLLSHLPLNFSTLGPWELGFNELLGLVSI